MNIIKGIDLSGNNANVDYDALKKAGYEYAIVKIGQLWAGSRSTRRKVAFKSSGWDTHTKGCISAGLKLGAYMYSMALNAEEAKEEAAETIKVLSGAKLDYPVYFDREEQCLTSLPRQIHADCYNAFAQIVKQAGYSPALYTNPSWLENYYPPSIKQAVTSGTIPLWLACWTDDPNRKPKYQYGQQMWQWGAIKPDGKSGYCAGSSAEANSGKIPGYIDANVCYAEYVTSRPSKTVTTQTRYNLRKLPSVFGEKIIEMDTGVSVKIYTDKVVTADGWTWRETEYTHPVTKLRQFGWSVVPI